MMAKTCIAVKSHNLLSCQKLDSRLERDVITCPDNIPDATIIVIDGSSLVNLLPPRAERSMASMYSLQKVHFNCAVLPLAGQILCAMSPC